MSSRTLQGWRRSIASVAAVGAAAAALVAPAARAAVAVPPSNRVTINLGETPWRYLKDKNPANAASPGYDDTAGNKAEVWADVGVPQSPSDNDTFLNTKSGGAEGLLTGATLWYRKHFKLDQGYSGRKVFVEFEGAHVGTQVYINGQLLPTNSLVNPDATHVQGFVPFIVDLTPYVKFGGADNVMAVKVSRGDSFFVSPAFSGAFRFGQSDGGLFRPVWMYIEDRVHIPQNTWATLNTWGTYVSTLSANDSQALVRVQTNVRNEYPTARTVTLSTQIVDQDGQPVAGASAQATASLPSNPLPAKPEKIAPETASPPATFDQTLTVPSPHLWYPNNSVYGKPYMYSVVSTVSIDGVVVDATSTPLGIRTITWDTNFPVINGHAHRLWGGSGRYDYPALGSAVPEEVKWRDLQLLADAGGSLWRPGHSSEGPGFIRAADNLGVMVIQPSGDGENAFGSICPEQTGNSHQGCNENGTDMALKKELHRDLIIHDRNNPSVLAWEANNGTMDTGFAQQLKAISRTWDPVQPRAQADRTDVRANGDLHSCSGDGCDVGMKLGDKVPDTPIYGAEYWGDGVQRALYDYELLFAVNPVRNWSAGLRANVFGIAHWYLADTPGEITTQVDGPNKSASPYGLPLGTQPANGPVTGTADFVMRGNAASMMDSNRFPRLLYYIYQAAWTPYDLKPVVKLGHHWNRAGAVTVNAFSNCPAVRLLINGVPQGSDQVPNPQDMNVGADIGPDTVSLPRQVHWKVNFASGTLMAQCLDSNARVVSAGGRQVVDTLVTAGAPDHIVLSVAPAVVRPDGSSFRIQANGSDAAFVTAKVVDAAGNLVPTANQIASFAVTTPATGTYRGGADSYVTFKPGVTPLEDMSNAMPEGYHAPGDPNLSFEGGLTKFAVKSTFVPGTVTVTASAPGLKGATASFTTVAIDGPAAVDGVLTVPAQSAGALAIAQQPLGVTVAQGQTATFNVLSSGSGTLTYQWLRNGVNIAGATGFSYTTPATAQGDSGSNYRVVVSNGTTRVESEPAILTVVPLQIASFTRQPQPQTVVAGQSAEFSVEATGSPTLVYHWRRNGVEIPDTNAPVYDTPPATAADDGAVYTVVVSNSAGNSQPSASARLTVAAAIAPTISQQPAGRAVSEGQGVTFSVVASGSNPLNYQWLKDGQPIANSDNAASFTIPAVTPDDAGSYQVRISNAASAGALSNPAVLTVSGSSGPDLALGMQTYESGEQGADLASRFAVDGDAKTSRWASGQVDDSWIAVDFGKATTFDRVQIVWENAYGKEYRFEIADTSPGDPNVKWREIVPTGALTSVVQGKPGPVATGFPSTTARALRMHGISRGTAYGYSMYEFQVYDVPQCGGVTERYTPLVPKDGIWTSTIAGLPDGPYVANVADNVSGLVWQQTTTTFADQGAQFTQTVASRYCTSIGMRLPTQAEALGISGASYAACAFHNPWTTWTSTPVPNQAGRAWFVTSTGESTSQIIDNAPGWVMCVAGTGNATPPAAAPAIATPVVNQTVAVGASATFSVVATGTAPLAYQWSRNGTAIAGATAASYTTPAATAADDGATFGVVVSNASGKATSSATLTVTAAAATPPPPVQSDANLALHAATRSSALEAGAYPASAATDGDAAHTRWSSAQDDAAWMDVDLGSAKTFNRIVLRWENAYGKRYTILTSNDGQTWSAPIRTQDAGVGGVEDFAVPATTARFVRMQGVARGTGYGYSLYEFEVYGSTAAISTFAITASAGANGTMEPAGTVTVGQGASQTFAIRPAAGYAVSGVSVDGQGVGAVTTYTFSGVQASHTIAAAFAPVAASANLALGRPASASGYEAAFASASAVDGNAGTRFSSNFADDAWFQVDLGTAQSVGRVVIDWENAYGTAYTLVTSTDGKTWSAPVFTQNAGKGGVETLDFAPVNARFVRMQGVRRSTPYGYSFWEFGVYGSGK